MRKLRLPLASLLTFALCASCGPNGSDKGDGGNSTNDSMNDSSGTGTGGDGDGDGDGESDICNGKVPAFVTPDCVLDLWNIISAASFIGGDVAAELLCELIDQAIKDVAQHSSDSVGTDQLQLPWLIVKALLFNQLSPAGDPGASPERSAIDLDPRTVDEDFPCGDGPHGFTVCASGNAFPAGEVLMLAALTEEAIPLQDAEWLKTFSFVFDADDDTNNNYVPAPAFPNDFFQDTDRWYQTNWDGTTWSLNVSTAIDSNIVNDVASDARVVFAGNTVMALIPMSEFTSTCPDWRVTTFAHKGDYGIDPPNEWSGALEPPVSMGLNACN